MKSIPTLASVALLAAVAALPVQAAGSSGGSGGSSGGSGSDAQTCPAGKVYSQQKLMCVDAQSSIVDDQSLVKYAYALTQEKRYQEALDTLDLMQNPETAEALNYRGYATRKLGRLDEGIGYYLRAVALDPSYTLVREYLGEAYLIKGDINAARQQLSEIEKRCGTTCEPYEDLAEAIQAAI